MSKNEKNTEKNTKAYKAEKRREKKAKIETMSPKERKKRLLKRIILILVIVLAVLFVAYIVLGALFDYVKKPVEQKEEKYQTFNHYDTQAKEEWKNIDIFSDEEYTNLDYKPHFTSPSLGGTYLLEDIPSGIENEAHRFFKSYFDIVQNGRYENYPDLFSAKYKETLTGFEKNVNREFPPQKLYNINIEELGRFEGKVVEDKECTIGLYKVSFLIHKNDGLFRSDIGRDLNLGVDVARPLLFELVTFDAGTENEKTYINNLYTESSITNNDDDR